ncbi:ribosomal protein S6 modification protein, putative [Methylophaga frappieri]|uniref:Ribosomal protein S6 modification protein, putative n=1 Tax=Methylophaga frappieri (strain ATCC BAA-2434 / DSM 25690 / JAM7) TaxID=754477 RepID=I1YJ21_METFJ|nr:RimK family alpha-L-glutamate ligase [Methylophaga frappieri]AFJ02914.1 ribosomal protein S6 modification protein, putative [Methylophaga frappieri]
MKPFRVAIFNDTHGWHSEQLIAAFVRHNMEAVLTDLALCRIDLAQSPGITIPGFEQGGLPDAVMVRGIAPGSLEQITLRMDILHTLAELGVPVLNPARVIELTVDKARTSLRLHQAGLRTPMTWACEDRDQAMSIVRRELAAGYQLVMKPLFGCQGKGIIRINHLDQLDLIAPVGHAFYLQRYISPAQQDYWQDWRLMVIRGHVVASMTRQSDSWITNFAQGARCLPAVATDEMKALAVSAAQAVEAPYAGVDLIQDPDGHFSVLEVNSVPAWKGLYLATGQDIAGALANMVAESISATIKQTPDYAL